MTVEEVAQVCHELAPFLINQFLQYADEEEFWKETFFYRWLTKEHDVSRPPSCSPSPC
jgi:hypothetical protein